SYILFLFFSVKMFSRFESPLLCITSFLILNLNPFLLDFFSLARGYGISIAMMMASLFFLYCYCQKKSDFTNALYSLVFGALATLAHLTLLNYFFALSAILVALIFFQDKEKYLKLKTAGFISVISVVVVCLLYP